MSLKTYSTISLPETTFYETYGLKSRIEVPHGKRAVFIFDITPALAEAKANFNNPKTTVNLQEFLRAMNTLKNKMYSTIMQKENEK